MHQRVAVSALSSLQQSFDEDIDLWADLGVHTVGLLVDKLVAAGVDRSVERVRAAGLGVSSVACLGFELARPEGWPERQRALLAAVDLAADVGAGCLFVTAGIHAEELGGRENPDAGALAQIFAAAGLFPNAVMRQLVW